MSDVKVKQKRGAKQRYDDPIHEAWRLTARDRYEKNKLKKKCGDEVKCL